MRTFENFPERVKCPICNKNTDKECTLIPIDGTHEGFNVEAIPVHVSCIDPSNMNYNRETNVIYIPGYKGD